MPRFAPPTTTDIAEYALVQRRVANLGLALSAIGVAFVVMRVIAVLAVDRPEYLVNRSMVVHYLAVVTTSAMWLSCRTGVRGRQVIRLIELVGLVGACSLYAVMAAGIPQAFRPEMTILLAFGLFLMAHAVHVPSSWQWTATLGGTLAVPLVVGAWLIMTPMDPRIVAASASAASSVQTTEGSIVGIGMASVITWWIVIVVTASVGSAVIYGLRREVRDAKQLGQYRLEGKLGEGGMGAVYRASHAMLRREAAIKVIKPGKEGSQHTRAQQRFEREAQVTANLKSSHTVQLYDFGASDEGAFYYVMELLDGIDLESMVAQYGPLVPERVVFVLRQCCESLEEAHAAELVHRDIKPANLFLCRHGVQYDFVKVLDFGLVALGPELEPDSGKLTGEGMIGGTPAYLAPEMAARDQVDGRADLYSLGCVAYWLLTGHPPFERQTPMATVIAHVNDEPAPLSSLTDTAIPAQLERVIMHCLAKKPEDRPASAADLSARLSAIEVRTWTGERAREWWQRHEPKRVEQPVAESDTAKITKAFG